MGVLKTLNNRPDVPLAITIRGRLTCMCPVNTRRDYATVEVSYGPTGSVLELESFAAYLSTFSEQAISHEDATADIRAAIDELVDPDGLIVRTTWDVVEGIECVVTSQ